jgi:hypothetical protein
MMGCNMRHLVCLVVTSCWSAVFCKHCLPHHPHFQERIERELQAQEDWKQGAQLKVERGITLKQIITKELGQKVAEHRAALQKHSSEEQSSAASMAP